MSQEKPSRIPPAPAKRQLRQEAGFGCCMCGNPIIQYHHIIEFSEEPHHRPEDMMILCPNHHHEATVGAISETTQRESKNHPYNIERGYVEGLLRHETKILAVELGGNYVVGLGFNFLVDDEPLMRLRLDERLNLLLSVELYNEDDELLVSIVDNEWISGNPIPWDIEFNVNRLTIRPKRRKIALTIDANVLPLTIIGDLWRKGQNFSLKRDRLMYNGVDNQVSLVSLGWAGGIFAANTKDSEFSLRTHPALKNGRMVSKKDPVQRLQATVEAYYELVHESKIPRNGPCLCGSGKKWKLCCRPYFY